jgi:hypothetical protein
MLSRYCHWDRGSFDPVLKRVVSLARHLVVSDVLVVGVDMVFAHGGVARLSAMLRLLGKSLGVIDTPSSNPLPLVHVAMHS